MSTEALPKDYKGSPRVGCWHYTDCIAVGRFDGPDGKQCVPFILNGHGWQPGAPKEPRPLFGLDFLRTHGPVLIAEGEKCAAALHALGLPAVCSMGGSNAPQKSGWTPLHGRECIVIPDNDFTGEKYAQAVATLLDARPKVLRLDGLEKGGDIVDWLQARLPGWDGYATIEQREVPRLRDELLALLDAAPVFDPAGGEWDEPKSADGPILRCVGDVKLKAVQWLWPDVVPLGKLTLIAGDPGLGKSQLTAFMVAAVTNKRPWPCGGGVCAPPGSALMLNAEDAVDDIIGPRLEAAGADMKRVHVLDGIRANGRDRGFSVDRDLSHLSEAIEQYGDVRLVTIDPLGAYLGNTDSHKDADVRSLLSGLASLAERHGVAIVVISHNNKSQTLSPMHRVTGSGAFVAAVRSAWTVVKDPDDGDRRLLLPLKCNLSKSAEGFAFRVDEVKTADGIETIAIAFEDKRETRTADEIAIAGPARTPGRKPDQKDAATALLRDWLSSGPVAVNDLRDRAQEAGISWPTIERAKSQLPITASKTGFTGSWEWQLEEDRRTA